MVLGVFQAVRTGGREVEAGSERHSSRLFSSVRNLKAYYQARIKGEKCDMDEVQQREANANADKSSLEEKRGRLGYLGKAMRT